MLTNTLVLACACALATLARAQAPTTAEPDRTYVNVVGGGFWMFGRSENFDAMLSTYYLRETHPNISLGGFVTQSSPSVGSRR